MRESEEKLIESTLSFWQARTVNKMTREDARQIVYNISGFFQILAEWETASRTQSKAPQLVLAQQPQSED